PPHSSLSSCSLPPPALPSFPTRRSSDLGSAFILFTSWIASTVSAFGTSPLISKGILYSLTALRAKTLNAVVIVIPISAQNASNRSEEHTSELQSRFDLVCRLLLEKKNNE